MRLQRRPSVSDLRSILNSNLPTCVASVSSSVKWMRNILTQPSVRLWYHPRVMRRQKMGAHTGHTDKTEEQACWVRPESHAEVFPGLP